ncbi:MAG: hypothetical protein AAF224_14565 [Pseudomonadota bacterium]
MLLIIEWPRDPFHFLVVAKYGSWSDADQFRAAMAGGRYSLIAPEDQEVAQNYRAQLEKLPTEEIIARVRALLDQKNSEIVEAAKDRDALSFFSQPSSDAKFADWVGLGIWHQDEAVALTFGKCPKLVNPQSLSTYKDNSLFASAYFSLLSLVERDLSVDCQMNSLEPEIYVKWAEKNSIELPSELARIIRPQSTAPERHVLHVENREVSDTLGPREKDTLLTIIATMASLQYGYTPLRKNQAAGKIVAEMEKMGLVPLSSETVRNKLKEASELVPQRFFTSQEKDKSRIRDS